MPDEAQRVPGEREFEQAGLLDGLEGEARGERVALLEYLARQGASLDELRRHTDEGTLMFLPAERMIGGGGRYTLRDVAERTGMDLDTLVRLRKAMGLPIPDPD